MNPSSEESLAPLPPLRIHHFLVWMAVAAVVFTMSRSVNEGVYSQFTRDVHGPGIGPEFSWTLIAYTLLQTLGVTIVGFGIRWSTMGLPFLKQAGIGLLLFLCVEFAWSVVGFIIFVNYFVGVRLEEFPPTIRWYLIWNWNIWRFLEGLIFLLCGIAISHPRRWRVLYLAICGWAFIETICGIVLINTYETFTPSLFQFLDRWDDILFFFFPLSATVFLLSYIVLLDCREGTHYHWSHWCGVAAFLLVVIIQLATSVWDYFSPYDWYALPPQSPAQTY